MSREGLGEDVEEVPERPGVGLESATVGRLLGTLEDVPADELARAATSLSRMPPRLVRRVISLVADPQVTRLIAP